MQNNHLQNRLVMGVDPGLLNTGWGIISFKDHTVRYVASGTIRTKSPWSLPEKLGHLGRSLTEVITTYAPAEAAIEETFVNKNAGTSLKLGHARGALMLTLMNAGLSPAEYAATLVKKSIVGVGRAEKNQVGVMIGYLLPGATPDSEDAADALAVALCHLHHLQSPTARLEALAR